MPKVSHLVARFRNNVVDFISKSSIEKAIARRQAKKSIQKKEKLVLLGTGWASYSYLKHLNTIKYDVTVVSPRNHFLFTPLLTSSAVGTLEFRSIAEPIRNTRDISDFKYIHAEVTNIDPNKKQLLVKSKLHNETPFVMDFDELVIGVGGINNSFGIPGVEKYANYLKELAHARTIRKKIIDCFENASLPDVSVKERERLLTFVVVGGGPTGVEFTAELNDFFVEDIQRLFPLVNPNEVKVILLEASGKILTAFDESLVKKTLKVFRSSGIDVKTHSPVKEVFDEYVLLADGTKIPYGLLVWSTGIGANPLIKNSPFEKDPHTGRILVDKHLRVKNFNNIYCFGDCSIVEGENYPLTAQVASQEGVYLAKEFNNKEREHPRQPQEFKFKFMGLLAYIGNKNSLFQTPLFDLSGFIAFLTWRSAYLTRLGSWRAKMMVPMDWLRTIVFGRDISNF
ncbi:hypothetical protein DICPUDRAFT_97816 [Dictyostelium purpureum]|uniref:Uncharacterized protein n=1 Tax=Dictyostelium purpureum TaxID=5786 RepID=F0ZK06_DICPU|nr:uncharacterized protein DICPUDRAFT_97816 [Dictyostelium purpureum]EGC35739.1 hypothetical protein DICPUDRAFT_97816 [Dictyostelium purpureum]|eukprot:XP_003287742.1 hypothetical protein DICPUDRAFT_97816 [Dictyostelium purpureum]